MFRISFLLFVLILVLPDFVSAQKDSLTMRGCYRTTRPGIYVQGGLLTCFLNQDKLNLNPANSFSGGISFKRQINRNSVLWMMINYQHKYFKGMRTDLYDFQYQKNVSLSTSFSNDEIETSLFYTLGTEKIEIGGGFSCSYLFAAVLNQEPQGDFGIYVNSIRGKYTKNNVRYTSPFYKTNISPSLFFSFRMTSRFSAIYIISYERLQNPVKYYSYFGPYNFINNKLLITLKLF